MPLVLVAYHVGKPLEYDGTNGRVASNPGGDSPCTVSIANAGRLTGKTTRKCYPVAPENASSLVGATEHSGAASPAQQAAEVFPLDTTPRHLLRDPDTIHGDWFRRRVKNMGQINTRSLRNAYDTLNT